MCFAGNFNPLFFFSVSLKFQACYITVQWGDFTVKNGTLLWKGVFHRPQSLFAVGKGWGVGGGRLNLQPRFQKGELDRTSAFREGVCRFKGVGLGKKEGGGVFLRGD